MANDVHLSSRSTSQTSDRRLVVSFLDERRIVSADAELVFGRRGDLVVDDRNRHLHRELGRFEYEDGHWWLANLGSSITLMVRDAAGGSSTRIAPGDRLPIPFAAATIGFSAGRANYLVTVEQPGLPTSSSPENDRRAPIDATVTASHLILNDEQRALLETLVRLDRRPVSASGPSRTDLADELGWSAAKVRRKLDYLCGKLADAGVTGLVGREGRVAADRRRRLADAAIDLGLVAPPADD